MRITIPVLVSALVSAAATVSAQAHPLSHLSFPSKPLLTIRTYAFGPSTAPTWGASRSSSTCPMPVYRMRGPVTDPMAVGTGGTPESMPVARSGCWNPLFPE